MSLLYLFYLLFLSPKILYDRLVRGKRHPHFSQRMGFKVPVADKPVIWIHGVSVGEVKALGTLFRELKKKYPHFFFLITTTTTTGQAEAQRSYPEADDFAYLPFDFSWSVKRFVTKLKPQKFILVESDFWPNLLSALKKNGADIFLVSGKLSERSARRFAFFPLFSKWIFSHFDIISVQNEEHFKRFKKIVPSSTIIQIGGNLKFDLEPQSIEDDQTLLKLKFIKPIITICSTHPHEEEWILNALKNVGGTLILAPRHPERFEEISKLLEQLQIAFIRYTRPDFKKSFQVLLFDTMGKLPVCYSLSSVVIVGGSFVENVGGHNVLEPSLYGVPVFFGPHMQSQIELASLSVKYGAGIQTSIETLASSIEELLKNPQVQEKMKKGSVNLIQSNRGATARTLEILDQHQYK